MTDHVEVTGHGVHQAVPALVISRPRVQWPAADVATALSRPAGRPTAALQAPDAHGCGERDRRTDDVGLHPRYDQHGQAVVGYTAYQSFRLTVRELDRVGAVLQALAGAAGDALAVHGVEMSVEPTATAMGAAREAAFQDARTRAGHYARLAGKDLGAVLLVREGGTPEVGPRPLMAKAADHTAFMPVEGGTHSIATTVTVRWELV